MRRSGRIRPTCLYRWVQRRLPIACVDVLLWRPAEQSPNNQREYLLIERKDGYGVWRWNLVGGRIDHGNAMAEAVDFHLTETLLDEDRPTGDDGRQKGTIDWKRRALITSEAIGDYVADSPIDNQPFDPRQHSVAATYAIELVSGSLEVNPRGEARDRKWFPFDPVHPPPVKIGFNQWAVISAVINRVIEDERRSPPAS